MLGNFSYHNPTKLYFGEDSLCYLKDELANYGKNVLLVYGGGSVRKNGIYSLKKFARFAVNVWGISPEGKTDEQLAEAGLAAMEGWMKELGLVMKISELGAADEMIEGIADATLILNGGYKVLDRDEIVKILKASM
ncbi:hypothetical protein [Ruminococcus sp.]|uniref:hypothetical protein n=1 Tax=Ruminococcus sp. TaxID=41978 RepID=UPI00345499B7|nr:iron-containing alcohol dehydrogenase [Ruminococcus sp.]